MNKKERQEKICALIRTNEVRTQKELRELLKNQGYDVTPATISRDMQEIQVRKEYSPNGVESYHLPSSVKEKLSTIQKLQQFFSEAIQSIEVSGIFVIIRTDPGNAKAIGYMMESLEWKQLAGVISGDDNCLLLCKTESEAEKVKKKCLEIWGKDKN
ncbi:arginine repressor [Virgibacillus dokdonensis]|uniref:Arginine repressor n=1 Tax=Virgibacillus dokdonensis TaxID=302167 RepID=A0ABU7VJF3_9BACI